MNLDNLSPKRKEQYLAVQAAMKQNPDLSIAQAEKEAGVPRNCYFSCQRALKGKAYQAPARKEKRQYKRKPKMITLPVEGPIETDKIVAFVGSKRSVIEAVREYQR